jgi:hypothetical protein
MMPTHKGNGIAREIQTTRRSLRTLDKSLRRLASMLGKVNGKAIGSRTRHLSPKARASLKLQGRYMGFMRQLKPRQKAQVRKIRETKGVRVAISRAQQLRSS